MKNANIFFFVGIYFSSNANAFEQPISHVRGNNNDKDNQKAPLSMIHVNHNNNGIHRDLLSGLGIDSCQANLATCQEKTGNSTVAIIDKLQASLAMLGLEQEDDNSSSDVVTAIHAALTSASETDFSAISGVTETNFDIDMLLQIAAQLPAAVSSSSSSSSASTALASSSSWTEKPNQQPQQQGDAVGNEDQQQQTAPFGDFYGTVLIAIETVLNTLIKSLDKVYSVGLSPLTDFITAVRKVLDAVPTGGIKLTTTIINEVITFIGNFIVYIVGITVAARSPELLSAYTSCVSDALQCEFDLVMMNAVPALVGEAYLVRAMNM